MQNEIHWRRLELLATKCGINLPGGLTPRRRAELLAVADSVIGKRPEDKPADAPKPLSPEKVRFLRAYVQHAEGRTEYATERRGIVDPRGCAVCRDVGAELARLGIGPDLDAPALSPGCVMFSCEEPGTVLLRSPGTARGIVGPADKILTALRSMQPLNSDRFWDAMRAAGFKIQTV